MASTWRENMLGYLSLDIIRSEKRTVFRERSSSKTVSFEEQIMCKDKYPSTFSPQMVAIVFIMTQQTGVTLPCPKSFGRSNSPELTFATCKRASSRTD